MLMLYQSKNYWHCQLVYCCICTGSHVAIFLESINQLYHGLTNIKVDKLIVKLQILLILKDISSVASPSNSFNGKVSSLSW